jgi:hypothetical protein
MGYRNFSLTLTLTLTWIEEKKQHRKKIIQPKLPYQPQVLGDFRNSFFVFVSDRSRSGLAENLGQIRFS